MTTRSGPGKSGANIIKHVVFVNDAVAKQALVFVVGQIFGGKAWRVGHHQNGSLTEGEGSVRLTSLH